MTEIPLNPTNKQHDTFLRLVLLQRGKITVTEDDVIAALADTSKMTVEHDKERGIVSFRIYRK